MPDRPAVVVFDVNETLSDLAPLRQRFAELGATPELAVTWFASVLRDGFALAAAGGFAPFGAIGEAVLGALLAQVPIDRSPADAVRHVMGGFAELTVHPDVADTVRALHGAGIRLVTLSNGAAGTADALLTRGGVRWAFEQLLSVDDAGRWKPTTEAYHHAARCCASPPQEMLLVAAHPWDVDGAARAGMRTAWVDRSGVDYPAHFRPPELTVATLGELPARLGWPPAGP